MRMIRDCGQTKLEAKIDQRNHPVPKHGYAFHEVWLARKSLDSSYPANLPNLADLDREQSTIQRKKEMRSHAVTAGGIFLRASSLMFHAMCPRSVARGHSR